jgi:hypothetical protein
MPAAWTALVHGLVPANPLHQHGLEQRPACFQTACSDEEWAYHRSSSGSSGITEMMGQMTLMKRFMGMMMPGDEVHNNMKNTN